MSDTSSIQAHDRSTPSMRSNSKSVPGCVELDRFCAACGYNLRTLPIAQEKHTGIWVVRCTECGQYQPADHLSAAYRPWLDSMTKLLVVGWMIFVLALMINLVIVESAISYGYLDEMTTYQRLDDLPENHPAVVWRQARGDAISQWTSVIVLRDENPEARLVRALTLGGASLASFVLGTFVVVVFPHWRRWAYWVLILVATVLGQGVVLLIWRSDAPYLLKWSLPHFAEQGVCQLIAGIVGALAGRPLARVSVCMLLPPSLRPRLAYLWLADGKPPPGRERRTEPSGIDSHAVAESV